GNTLTPGRRRDSGSGSRHTSRGWPSSSARSASATTVGRVQLPPTQPWKASRVTSAVSPTWAEVGGVRATTVASTNGAPRRTSSEARWSSSSCMVSASCDLGARALVVGRQVDVAQRALGPVDDHRVLLVAADHLLGATFAGDLEQLVEQRAVVQRRWRLHGAVV